jgi:hypothetical protein
MTRKPVMHLLITDKCDRDCKWCCNKQYDVNDIPVATKEEYESVNTVCLKEARFSTVYLIGELKKKGYFENIKCDSKVLVKDILANCEVIQ